MQRLFAAVLAVACVVGSSTPGFARGGGGGGHFGGGAGGGRFGGGLGGGRLGGRRGGKECRSGVCGSDLSECVRCWMFRWRAWGRQCRGCDGGGSFWRGDRGRPFRRRDGWGLFWRRDRWRPLRRQSRGPAFRALSRLG